MADASLGTATLRTKLDSSGLKTGLEQAKGETQKFAQDTTAAIKGVGAAFGAVIASKGVQAYIGFMRSSAKEANQAATATALFEKAVRRNNEAVNSGSDMVQRLSDKFGVAASVIEDSATTMLRQGASLELVEKTLVTAGASAAAAGTDISRAFENVTTAVVSGNSVLLRSSGIIAGLGEAERAYAQTLGKTVEQLTQQEKLQARVNAIYEETRSEIEDLDTILQGLPRAQAEVTRQWSNFRQTAGDMALKVITPLTQGLGSLLGFVNSLPTPIKNAGIAMAGAAVGASALAAGFVAIKTALTGFNALGLLSFGPVGWVVLGATAVAGLAAVLSGGKGSLDKSAREAAEAFNRGDANSLTGALDGVISKFDGDFKDALERAQDELRETGRVGIENANNIARAFHSALAQASMMQSAGLFGMFQPVSATLRQAGASMFGDRRISNADQQVQAALASGDLERALVVVNDVLLLLKDMPSTARDSLVEFRNELVRSLNAVAVAEFVPFVPTGDGGGTPADMTDIQKRVAALRAELAALSRELDFGRADPATLAERQAGVMDSAIRDLIRLGAGDDLLNALLGELGEFEAAVRKRAVLIAPIIRAELMDERLRAERDEIDRMSTEARQGSTVAAQRRESDRLAAAARAPIIRAVAWDNAWFDERQEIEEQAIRAHNEARIAQQKRESERLAAIARAPFIRAEEWDLAWFAEMEETEALIEQLNAERVMRENRNQAAIRAIIDQYNQGGQVSGAPLFNQNQAYLDGDVQRQAARMRGMDLTTTNTDRAIIAERELALEREAAAEAGRQLTAELEAERRLVTQQTAALRLSGDAAATYTRQVNLQAQAINLAAREGITLTEAFARLANTGRSAEDVRAAIQDFERIWATAGDDAGRAAARAMIDKLTRELQGMEWSPGLKDVFGEPTPDYKGITESALQSSAENFQKTIISAGISFTDTLTQGLMSGDLGAVIKGGFGAAGTIIGAIPGAGIPGLIFGGLAPLLGGLLGGLFGGTSNRQALESTRAAGAAVRGAPAIDLNIIVNQSLNIQSLTDTASRRAV